MNKSFYLLLVIIVVNSLILSSCSNVLMKAYGVNKLALINVDSISKIVKRDSTLCRYDNYYIDKKYVAAVWGRFPKDSLLIKNLLQPMQAMYFDSLDNLVSYHINCLAGGFPNLKWNRNKVFQTFPPVSQDKCDPKTNYDFHKVSYGFIKDNLISIVNGDKGRENNNETEIIVCWNYEWYKQSKRLIDLVMDNLKMSQKPVHVQFVNTDYLYK